MKNKPIVVLVIVIALLITSFINFSVRRPHERSLPLPPAKISNLTNWLQSAEILLSLGSNVQASADEMVVAIGNNNAERFRIVETLGQNKLERDASVLLLRGLLKDKEPGIRANVLNMLIMQRHFAQAARPDILQLTNDQNAMVRANATHALLCAFPEPDIWIIPDHTNGSPIPAP
jgi:hypothetical protein